MKSLREMLTLPRPKPVANAQPPESTHDELVRETQVRTGLKERRTRLSVLLADYRRHDEMFR